MTYASIARLVGIKSPRKIGNILHANQEPEKIPCHRVVNSRGEVAKGFAFGGASVQRKILGKEGVSFKNGTVDLEKNLWQPSNLFILYFDLLKRYGEPGPWPWFIEGLSSSDQNLSTPDEIAIGSILTQNTSWKNVEKAIKNLKKERVCTIGGIYSLGKANFDKLKTLIRPSGYYNQKANRLFEFCKHIVCNYQSLRNFFKLSIEEARFRLLRIHGIGKETADTILLYAGNKPIFVIDAYTKKFAQRYKLKTKPSYDDLQKLFTESLPQNVKLYQDFHALIVRWGKAAK